MPRPSRQARKAKTAKNKKVATTAKHSIKKRVLKMSTASPPRRKSSRRGVKSNNNIDIIDDVNSVSQEKENSRWSIRNLSSDDGTNETSPSNIAKDERKKRPARRGVTKKKMSYTEDPVDDYDSATGPESSDDDEDHEYTGDIRQSTPSKRSKKRNTNTNAKTSTASLSIALATGKKNKSGTSSSPLHLVALSPANIRESMWQPNKSDWRDSNAIDY